MTDLRIGILGVGRIGKMHAELIERQTPGATVSAVYDVFTEGAAAVGGRRGFPRRGVVARKNLIGADDVDAVAICSSTDTHIDLLVAAADAGKADLHRETAVARPRRGRARGRRGRGRRRPRPGRVQPPVRMPATRRSATGSWRATWATSRWCGSPAVIPAPPPDRVHRGVGRDLPRHDDPRLRHGPVRHRQRGRPRSTQPAR